MWDELVKTCDRAINNLHNGREYYQKIKSTYENYQREEALQEVLSEYKGESGYHYENQRIKSYGLCFAELVDFEGDGKKKLVTTHTSQQYDIDYLPSSIDDYTLEIWDYAEGKAQKVYEGKPYYGSTGEREVIILNTNNQRYLKIKDMNADGKVTYLRFKGGEVVQNTEPEITIDESERYVLQGYHSDETKVVYNAVSITEQKLTVSGII